jgi:Zinc-binding dehydrogenase
VRSLGVDRVIDYTREDFTTNGETCDVIFDAVGKHSFRRSRDSLKGGGTYLAADGLINLVLSLRTPLIGGKNVVLFSMQPRDPRKDVRFLQELIESGRYRVLIDRSYSLEDVVDATRYVETEQKRGNVVLTVSGRLNPAGIVRRVLQICSSTRHSRTSAAPCFKSASAGSYAGSVRHSGVWLWLCGTYAPRHCAA